MQKIRVLTFTTLFPNKLQPNNAIFIKNRMAALCQYCPAQLKIIAPVPYFPPLAIFKKWYIFSRIPDHEIQDGLEVFHPRYLVTPKIGMSLYGLSMFLTCLPLVRKIYKTFPFDLIDAHYIYPDGLAAIFLGKVFKCPVVVSARGTDINLYPEFAVIKRLIQYTLKHATHIMSVCADLKRIMLSLGVPDDKITVIPNGIYKDKFFRLDPKICRKKVEISNRHKVLLSVGSLIERKGHHILIDSIRLLVSQNRLNFKTYIVGTGEWEQRLAAQIEQAGLRDWVFLVGQVPNDDLVYWYNAADLFFMGSSREGWPNVVCEALACGVPVVATSANGIPEIITSDEYGLIVERNAQAFAKGLLEAFSRDWDYDKIYKYGQRRTWKTVANEVYDVFTKVLLNQQLLAVSK